MTERFPHTDKSAHSAETSKEYILDGKELSDIFFWSFYYSQGDINLHKNIFAHIFSLHSNWKLQTNFNPDKFIQREIARFETFLNSPAHKRLDLGSHMYDLRANLEMAVGLMQQARSEKGVREKLCKKMIELDFKFTVGQRRESGSGTRPEHGPFDRRKSQFISYIILGEKAPGPPVFTEVMKIIRNHVEEDLTDVDLVTNQLRVLILSYENDHSDKKIDLTEFPKIKDLLGSILGSDGQLEK